MHGQSAGLTVLSATLSALMPLGSVQAQVHYYDLDAAPTLIAPTADGQVNADPCAGRPSGCQSSGFNEGGWLAGTQTQLGTTQLTPTHDFFRFHLGKTSDVTIVFWAASDELHPAFSLYNGVLPVGSLDDTATDPLVPIVSHPESPMCFDNVASPTDTGGSCQPHDGFRDTLTYCAFPGGPFSPECGASKNPRYTGQFDAFANWSIANDNGEWSLLSYLASVSLTPFTGRDGGIHSEGALRVDPSGGANLTLRLPAGDYTIAAGSESCRTPAPDGSCSGGTYYGTLNYAATSATFDVTFSTNPQGYMIDGRFRPELMLYAGRSYDFNVNTLGHPFFLAVRPGALDMPSPYATNNGTTSGVITLDVPQTAIVGMSTTVAYECELHPGQEGGLIELTFDPAHLGGVPVPALPILFAVFSAGLFLTFGLKRSAKRDAGRERGEDTPRDA